MEHKSHLRIWVLEFDLLDEYTSTHNSHQVCEIIIEHFMNKFTSFVFPSRVVTEMISLDNPTHETLELHATNSNTENFVLEIKRIPVSIFRKLSNLPLLEHFAVLILAHHGALAIELQMLFF